MSLVGELLRQMSDDERERVLWAVTDILRDEGRFAIALLREGSTPPALGRAAQALDAGPWEAFSTTDDLRAYREALRTCNERLPEEGT